MKKWSRNGRPNLVWIKDKIQKSKALFLILTKNIVKNQHTQNWVAFEIGIASACNPMISVFVFREENIDFPVPYLNHYFDQPLSNTNHLFSKDFSENLLNVLFHYVIESFVDGIIKKDVDKSLLEDESEKCSNCLLRFHYCGMNEKFNCPCCSTIIVQDSSKEKERNRYM